MEPSELERFEAMMLPHLSAAHGLARYMTRNEADADDLVQEAFLRALKYFDSFRGEEGRQSRAWVLAIVRNVAHTWRDRQRANDSITEFDETVHSEANAAENPGVLLARQDIRETLVEALNGLPTDLREVIVLREVEGLSYKEMSEVVEVPVGTIMSRLARARKRLQEALTVSDREA